MTTDVRHHVLLIGIDAYDGGGMLTGCVNDIDVVQRLLIDRVGIPPAHIRRLAAPRFATPHETDVAEELPLLATMRAAFERLGTDEVKSGDRVLIYYSGHGTQTIVTDAQQRRFAREAILPKDKLHQGEHRLLFDWELNALVSRIAARTSHVTVILDCCNSGGVTRDIGGGGGGRDRFFRVADEIALPDSASAPPTGSARGVASAIGSLQTCQVVAACREDQRARESSDQEGASNGELTRALIDCWSDVPPTELPDLRWGRIWRAVEAAVWNANPRQSPWLSGRFGRRVFGFGPDDETDPGFSVVEEPGGYRIDVGSLAGVTVDAEVGVYAAQPPSFPALDSEDDLAARKGVLRVVHAERASSKAVASAPFVLPDAPRGRLVRAGRDARLRVAVTPVDADLIARLEASPLIESVDPQHAELTLVRRPDGWALTDDVHGVGDIEDEPVLATVPHDRRELARAVAENYRAYSAPLRLARACRDLPSLLRLSLLDGGDAPLSPDTAQHAALAEVKPGVRSTGAPYELAAGDRLCFAVDNAADVALSVTLLDCAPSGRVVLLGEARVPPQARHVFWSGDTLGVPFVASLPDDRRVGVDRIVAIGTSRADVSLRNLESSVSFASILTPTARSRSLPRDFGTAESAEPTAESWTSTLTAARVVSPGSPDLTRG